MAYSKQRLGRWGEEKAAAYLMNNGFTIIEKNYRCEHGEIDLVAKKGNSLIFVEVKTRSGKYFGFPEEAVNEAKQSHLIASAQAYLQEKIEGEINWRIDVIAIVKSERKESEIEHFENAVQ